MTIYADAVQLVDALRPKYPREHGWIVLPQVRDGTGAGAGRTADALAFNAWPSRGMELHGFELKISRGDWLRELRQPEKADRIFAYCDRWWLVTPADRSDAIVRAGELPPTWGHLTVDQAGKAVGIESEAPKLEPKALDRVFLAAVIRCLEGCEAPAAKLAAARQEGVDEGRAWQRRFFERSRRDEATMHLQSLLYLESSAERVLKSLRRELADVRAGLPSIEPSPEQEPQPSTPTQEGDQR